MKTINLEQSLKMGWCYNEERLREIAGDKEHWSALDILALEYIPLKDRLFAVLDERLIDAHILHEFACRCAERALARDENPDQRSVAAVIAKRAWLKGEIADSELKAAKDAAWGVASDSVAREASWNTLRDAAEYAAYFAAKYAAWDAAWNAARNAALNATRCIGSGAEREWQVAELIKMLEADNDKL